MIAEDDPRVAQIGHPAPPWLINYADLMTELVCFFVILYALSAALNKDMQKAQQVIEEMMKEGQMQGMVKMDKEGLRITLEEQGAFNFFESGSAEITENMSSKLNKLSEVLKPLSLKNDIVVEGHTDNVPLGAIGARQFPTNWELSTARATSVVRYFLASGYPPKRMSAIGYGEFHPISPNDTEDNRRKNRRVVFFVKTNPYPDAPAAKALAAGAVPATPAGAAAEPVPPAPQDASPEAPQAESPPQDAEGL